MSTCLPALRFRPLGCALATACLDDDFEACIAHLKFPLGHRRAIRTTNLLKRRFGEERRRTKAIPHAFGERAVLKLMYAALIRAAERWRGIRITEFEQRQLRAIRGQLDAQFTTRNAPVTSAAADSFIQRPPDLTNTRRAASTLLHCSFYTPVLALYPTGSDGSW